MHYLGYKIWLSLLVAMCFILTNIILNKINVTNYKNSVSISKFRWIWQWEMYSASNATLVDIMHIVCITSWLVCYAHCSNIQFVINIFSVCLQPLPLCNSAMNTVLVKAIQLLLQSSAGSSHSNANNSPSIVNESLMSAKMPVYGTDASTLNNQYVRVTAEIKTR